MKNQYIVKKDTTLLKYLYEILDLPKKKIKQYLTHGCIYVNQTQTTKYDYPLKKNMTITIQQNTKDFIFPILYEDRELIVVEKPSGLLTVASLKEKENTLYYMLSNYVKKKDKNAKIFIVHRLDKDTSGIIVFAKNQKMKEQLQKKWDQYAKVREYKAIVEGIPKKEQARLVHYLKETTTHLVYTSKTGKKAITSYQVEKTKKNYSLLRIFIETGRKNQIRVQLAEIGNPIVGDHKYNKTTTAKRLFLHATRLKLFHPTIGKVLTFTSPLPKEFEVLMR